MAARALFGAAVAVVATVQAEAASRFCRELEQRLAEPAAGSTQFRRYDRAVNEQRDRLMRAERQAERAGCFDGFGGRECLGLMRVLERMDRNLAMLDEMRSRFVRRADPRIERQRILMALDANNCLDEERPARRLPPPISGEEGEAVFRGPFPPALSDLTGTYRTLCVRTCDGYYFPMSFAVTSADFGRDEERCEAMCPGTEVKLYFHRVPGEESADMVSTGGVPYSQLPNAFRYRQPGYEREKGCGCSPEKDFSIIAGEPPNPEGPAELGRPTNPIPAPRPDRFADPETLANREGGLDAAAIRAILKPKPAGTAGTSGERKIRVVGPVFLPDPEEAIDLQIPGRSEVR